MFDMDPILAGMLIGAGTMLILWIIVLNAESRQRRNNEFDEREFVGDSINANLKASHELKSIVAQVRSALARGEAHQYGLTMTDLRSIETNLVSVTEKIEEHGKMLLCRWKVITSKDPH